MYVVDASKEELGEQREQGSGGSDSSYRERTRLKLQGKNKTQATGRGPDSSDRKQNRL